MEDSHNAVFGMSPFLFFLKSSSQGKFYSEKTIDTKLSYETFGRNSATSSNCIDIYKHDLAAVV